jgi:antirepressor protein
MLAEVIQIQPVQFYDDVVRSCKAPNGRIYAVVNDMCACLGLASHIQLASIQKDELYQGFTIWVELHKLHTSKTFQPRKALALDLDMVPIWLTRIKANRVSADVKPKLLRYQREAARGCAGLSLLTP